MSNLSKVLLSRPDVAVGVLIVTPRNLSEEITELLVREGVIEPRVLEAGNPLIRELENYIALLEEAKKVYAYLESNLEKKTVVKVEVLPESIKKTLENLLIELRKVYEEVSSLNNLISSYENQLTTTLLVKQISEDILKRYPGGSTSLVHHTGRYLAIRTLVVPESSAAQIKNLALEVIAELKHDKRVVLTCAFSSERLLEALGSLPEESLILEPGVSSETTLQSYISNLESKLAEISKSIESLRLRKREILESKIRDLALLKAIVESEYERLKVLKGSIGSRYTVAISGWILKSKLKSVLNHLSSYPVYVVTSEDENPPVDFDNLKPFKPFELITELYGFPTHYEWDPTPLLAYSFLLFYSLMMADVGYGLGIVLATRYLLPKFVSDPDSPGFKRLQKILYAGGLLSSVVGLLAKSFLGSLLGKYIPIEKPIIDTGSIMGLVGISLAIGYAFTFLSHSIALAKNARLGRTFDALFEAGILVIMVGGPFLVSKAFNLAFLNVTEDIYMVAQVLTLVGLAMVVLSRLKTMGGVGGFLWLFDVVGIAGDVFSYIRIAGIAAGTALLAELFNNIVVGVYSSLEGISTVVGVAVGALATVFIHTFNLALSAVSPFIHSLRLCLFEISSKFYEGQGRRLKPVKVFLGKIAV